MDRCQMLFPVAVTLLLGCAGKTVEPTNEAIPPMTSRVTDPEGQADACNETPPTSIVPSACVPPDPCGATVQSTVKYVTQATWPSNPNGPFSCDSVGNRVGWYAPWGYPRCRRCAGGLPTYNWANTCGPQRASQAIAQACTYDCRGDIWCKSWGTTKGCWFCECPNGGASCLDTNL